MSRPVIITCAVTGGDDVADRFAAIPVTPEQIARECLEAHEAGAAIVHIHVRDPRTGKPSMEIDLYAEVVRLIRESNSDLLINLTTGPGARFVPSDTERNGAAEGSNLRPPQERVRHIVELRPDICSLDMGSLNFGKGTLINVPRHIETIAAAIYATDHVKPELEIFDSGHLALALDMIRRGLIEPTPLFQIVLGVPWGAPATTETMSAMKSLIPHASPWAAFGIGRHEFPMVAQAALLGGHVRVGLEDNLYIEKGVPARGNAELVRKAARIIELLGYSPATTDQARELLGIEKPARNN